MTRTATDPTLLDSIDALGWHCAVVNRVRLFGEQVTAVAAIDHQAHTQRVASGWTPVTDVATINSWDLPELWPAVVVTSDSLAGPHLAARHGRRGQAVRVRRGRVPRRPRSRRRGPAQRAVVWG